MTTDTFILILGLGTPALLILGGMWMFVINAPANWKFVRKFGAWPLNEFQFPAGAKVDVRCAKWHLRKRGVKTWVQVEGYPPSPPIWQTRAHNIDTEPWYITLDGVPVCPRLSKPGLRWMPVSHSAIFNYTIASICGLVSVYWALFQMYFRGW